MLALQSAALIEKPKSKEERMRLALLRPELAIAELCRRSFSYFIRRFWDCVSQEELKWNWHLDVLAAELQSLAERVALNLPKKHDLIFNVPPGTTKSITAAVMFPAWCWTRWPWFQFIAASYSAALSLEHAEKGRDLVRHEKFKYVFPELDIKADKDTKSNFRITQRQPDGHIEFGGNRFSTSVGGTLTGYHGHILIVDDPLNPNQAFSEVELMKANRWMDQTLSVRKVDKAVTPMILIMQRLHQNDPTGHILSKRKKNVRRICLPGEIRNFREEVEPAELIDNYIDDLLDPVRMPWSVMEELLADLGQYGYAGQVGQKPTPPGGGMFKTEHFQVVDSVPGMTESVPVRYWDKAATPDGGCFTVGVKMSRLPSGKFLIWDVKRGQWASDVREAIIKETAVADGYKVYIYIEQEPGSGGKDSANATIRNLAGFSVYADLPTGNKVHRADPFSVQVNAGNVYLLRASWNKVFTDECQFFPFSTYKDQVDAASGAFGRLMQKRVARVLS